MKEIRVKHRGTEIWYDETKNTWSAIVNGRERSFASLKDIKSLIEMEPKKKKPFERIKAWLVSRHNSEEFTLVEITGLAESKHEESVWVVDKEGYRAKVGVKRLFAYTDENRKRIDNIQSIQKKQDELREIEQISFDALDFVTIPDVEE